MKLKLMKSLLNFILSASLLLLLASCAGNKPEVWASNSGTLTFNGDTLTIAIHFPTGQERTMDSKKTYTIVQKLDDEYNKSLSLYILKGGSDSLYTLLPEMRVNDSVRRFDLFSLSIRKPTLKEINDGLDTPIKGKTAKYVIFGAAVGAKEYKRE